MVVQVIDRLQAGFRRATVNQLYTTSEDFSRANSDDKVKRILVIGGSGVGKSTLLNILAGFRLVLLADNSAIWKNKQGDEIAEDKLLFYATTACLGVTQKAALAHLNWMGNSERHFIAVDTVGVNDAATHDISDAKMQDLAKERAYDLHDKLTNLGHIDALLVLNSDSLSGKFGNGVIEVLKMLDSKFPTAAFWNNVMVAITQCNTFDRSWKARTQTVCENTQKTIKQMFPRSKDVQVPVIHLGGQVTEDDADAQDGRFEELWKFIQSRERLDTSSLLEFDDSFAKFRRATDERNKAEALAKAARIYPRVVSQLVIVLLLLFARAWFVPEIVMWFTLNSEWLGLTSTWLDEIIFFVTCIYYIGPQDVENSLHLFYEDWLQAHIEPLLEKVSGGGKQKAA